MTDKEYEQKKRECWAEFCRMNPSHNRSIFLKKTLEFGFDRAYDLGKQEKDADTVIQGWVARDKNGLLNFFYGGSTPYKNDSDGDWNTAFGRVLEYLPREMFPDLTWESEPEPVEIIIKRKKNG